ncbi:MAG: GET complex subunit get1 [Pleopsidium flavum]|nr:MAG: GET complex subunit get1 [Pleopsidium flavum]
MPSLLMTVFVLQLAIHLVNTLGAVAINDLLWTLFNKLPTPTSKGVQDQTLLRREVVRLKREMNSTSSQDQFAKWAKLRRQHDKALAEYDQKTNSLTTYKTSFDNTITISRWLGTNGLRFFLQFWYARQPLFWIPQNWLPGYVEWLLAFPRAPRGSVSIQIWGIACASVIQLVSAAAVAIYALGVQPTGGKRKTGSEKGEPMKISPSGGGTPQGRTGERKKEF